MNKLFFLFFLAASIRFVFADGVEGDSVKYHFNPVVVTATKIQGAQRDIAASVSVLDEQMIKGATSSSALDLVKTHIPGFFVTERAVMGYGVAQGSAGGLSIRGVGGTPTTGVLVLRDGRPDIMGMMGHPLPDAYSLDGIERVEVVRGPASFLYGTNAMGGVINLVSKKMIDDGFQTRISASAGNFNSQKFNAHHGGKIDGFDYYVTASTRRTDGHRENSDYEGSFFSSRLGYSFSSNTSIDLNANYSDIYLLDPGLVDSPVEEHWYDIIRSGADLSLRHASRIGESFLKVHGNFGEHKIYDGWRSQDQTVGFMFYHNAQMWRGATTTVGFDYKRYGGDAQKSEQQKSFIDYSEHFMTEWAPYAHFQQVIRDQFIASAGLRFEQHNLYGSELLPKFGLVVHATPATAVRVSAAKGFRSPSIRELYIFPSRNEELQPERLWNYEIGITQRIGLKAEGEAVVFQSNGDNMIRLQYPDGTPQYFNSGDFVHTGYELLARWRPSSRLNISATWSDTDFGDETLGAPEQKMTLVVGYDVRGVNLMTTILHAAQLYGADNRQDKLPDYTVVNAAVSFSAWKSLTLRFSLRNAFDQQYQTISGYPMPGRTFMSELSFNF